MGLSGIIIIFLHRTESKRIRTVSQFALPTYHGIAMFKVAINFNIFSVFIALPTYRCILSNPELAKISFPPSYLLSISIVKAVPTAQRDNGLIKRSIWTKAISHLSKTNFSLEIDIMSILDLCSLPNKIRDLHVSLLRTFPLPP